jgi:hypothetical protein
VERNPGTEPARETVRTGPWLELYDQLAARHRAHAAFRRAGDGPGAARTAARLFHDDFYRGENAVAVGWRRRGFREVERDPGAVERGWLECAQAELHLHAGAYSRLAWRVGGSR